MSSIIDDLRPFLRCSICLETFTEPKILPCAHRFCKNCLSHEMDSSVTSESNPSFPCPNCRTKICLPRNRHRNEWTDYFKTDCLLKGMLERMEENQGDSTDVCDSHKLRLEIVCYSCTMIGCVRCAWEKHRHCPRTTDFKSEAVRTEHDLKHYLQKIERVIQTIDDLVNPQFSTERSFKEQELNSNKYVEQCIKQKQHRFKSACLHLIETYNWYVRQESMSNGMARNIKEAMQTLLEKLDIDAKCKEAIEQLKERNSEVLLTTDMGTASVQAYHSTETLELAEKLNIISQDISQILTLEKRKIILQGQQFLVDNEEILSDQYHNRILGDLPKQNAKCTLDGLITREDQVDFDITKEEELLGKIGSVIKTAGDRQRFLDDLTSLHYDTDRNMQTVQRKAEYVAKLLISSVLYVVYAFLCVLLVFLSVLVIVSLVQVIGYFRLQMCLSGLLVFAIFCMYCTHFPSTIYPLTYEEFMYFNHFYLSFGVLRQRRRRHRCRRRASPHQ